MTAKECIICLLEIEDGNERKCSDERCKQVYCADCLIELVKLSAFESTIPKCPARDCNSYIILRDMFDFPKDVLTAYQHACLDYFVHDCGDEVKKQMQQKAILIKLRQERQKFIGERYPAAIVLVAGIAFTSKIKRMEKTQSKTLQEQIAQTHRSCMNSTCSGFLNQDLECMLCQTSFCKKCETAMEVGHVCKQEDLDSINMINNMIHCPGCKLPVFKNQGCNSITCGHCHTKFKYDTGEEGGGGSFNVAVVLAPTVRYRLSHQYEEKIPAKILPVLLEIESLEPKPRSRTTLLGPIKKYFETKDRNVCARDLARQVNMYHSTRFRARDYQTRMVQLEHTLKQSEMSVVKLRKQVREFLAWLIA